MQARSRRKTPRKGRPDRSREKLAALAALRRGAGHSQQRLDEAIGASAGTVAQMEFGTMLPPSYEVCEKIDDALGQQGGTTWEACAPYRMRRVDPYLWNWHLAQLDNARRYEMSVGETLLVQTVRDWRTAVSDPEHFANTMIRAVDRMFDPDDSGMPYEEPVERRLARAWFQVADMPVRTARRLWVMFAELVGTVYDFSADEPDPGP